MPTQIKNKNKNYEYETQIFFFQIPNPLAQSFIAQITSRHAVDLPKTKQAF